MNFDGQENHMKIVENIVTTFAVEYTVTNSVLQSRKYTS